jgi:hypothetical protein
LAGGKGRLQGAEHDGRKGAGNRQPMASQPKTSMSR